MSGHRIVGQHIPGMICFEIALILLCRHRVLTGDVDRIGRN
jgi:hypothetical protein